MNRTSHKGATGIGDFARRPSAVLDPAAAAHEALEYSRDVSQSSAETVLALVAFTANQALSRQIELTHDLSRFAREQAQELANAGQRAFPEGPLRDTVTLAARMQTNLADSMAAAANQWGRSFGHLAFAFPLPDRSH